MAATTTSSTTSDCSGFFNLQSIDVEASAVKPSSCAARGSTPSACGKLDGVAIWFINGVATAFFASLERCSCIRIATEDDSEEANDVPLIHSDGNSRHDAGTSRRRRRRKGKKGEGALLED
ncbi:hypothetical protein F3Y22_tig00116964pilonHSYRG00272 [Hibiscus syriacus]|uniref:Uncharacterized protein n=1 Tax=Hibiscus syriacus TaxID=106335 RepID=A0A6A2WKC0_HIBSY|nr:hypothetical protein F3Y22_tig00116964pilonHSYRG00272 [Hibiscus syriacus]